jgi:hypothetical protein
MLRVLRRAILGKYLSLRKSLIPGNPELGRFEDLAKAGLISYNHVRGVISVPLVFFSVLAETQPILNLIDPTVLNPTLLSSPSSLSKSQQLSHSACAPMQLPNCLALPLWR